MTWPTSPKPAGIQSAQSQDEGARATSGPLPTIPSTPPRLVREVTPLTSLRPSDTVAGAPALESRLTTSARNHRHDGPCDGSADLQGGGSSLRLRSTNTSGIVGDNSISSGCKGNSSDGCEAGRRWAAKAVPEDTESASAEAEEKVTAKESDEKGSSSNSGGGHRRHYRHDQSQRTLHSNGGRGGFSSSHSSERMNWRADPQAMTRLRHLGDQRVLAHGTSRFHDAERGGPAKGFGACKEGRRPRGTALLPSSFPLHLGLYASGPLLPV